MTRLSRPWSAVAIGAIALLYLPLLAVALFSFNAAERGLQWTGFTLQWYVRAFSDRDVLEVTRNTIILAVASTLVSTLLGTLLAVGLDRFPWPRWFGSASEPIVQLPVVTPDIIFAAVLVVAFRILRDVSSVFEPGMLAMILGHVTFQVSFVALVVRGRLATIGPHVEEAARDLYASGGYLLRRITLPLLLPGIVAGGMLAFVLSLDDFVISFFTYSDASETLPIRIYGEMRRGITTKTYALSTALFLVTVLLVIGLERLTPYTKEK